MQSRLRQLDGLRGIAALIVIVHHSMLLAPRFATTYLLDGNVPVKGSILWWITATPLKLFTAGGEAVTVFFVLSGIVLTLPVLARANFDWVAYYPRRVVRLWIPAAVSILFACALYLVAARPPVAGFSIWVTWYDIHGLTIHRAVSAMDILFGDISLNNPLWSLRWELLFSLALPVVIACALITRKMPYVGLVAAAAIVGLGVLWQVDALRYLPSFLAGAIIAVSLEKMHRHAATLSALRLSHLWWALLTAAALMLLITYWLFRPRADASLEFRALTITMSTLGATALVVTAMFWKPVVWFLTTRVVQWLGRISFSLYLVHVPIAIAAVNFLGPARWKWAIVITLISAPLVATVFTRLVEKPSHKLAQRAGSRLSGRLKEFEVFEAKG